MQRFELKDGKSSKFWEIDQAGAVVMVRYGRIGTQGQSQSKDLGDEGAASRHLRKLIAEKRAKGYVEAGAAPGPDVGIAQSAGEPVSEPQAGEEGKPEPKPKAAAKSTPKREPTPVDASRDPEASAESLEGLYNRDDPTNRRLASHGKASAALLEKLSHSSDEATRRAVAGNAGTPVAVYLKLGQQFPKAFLANPQLDLLLLENPALLEEVPEGLLVQILRSPSCPEGFLVWAAGRPSIKVQLAVAVNAKAPAQALALLRSSGYEEVRQSVPEVAQALDWQDAEAMLREAVREQLQMLRPYAARDLWREKSLGLPQLPFLSADARLGVLGFFTLRMFDEGRDSLHGATALVLEALAEGDEFLRGCHFLRRGVAMAPNTPVHVLERLSRDTVPKASGGKPLPWHDDDAYRGVRSLARAQLKSRLAAKVPDAAPSSPDVERILSKGALGRQWAAQDARCPASLLALLAADKDESVRAAVAANPATPLPVIERLLSEKNIEIKRALARNPSMPPEALAQLAKNKDFHEHLAGNPGLPVSMFGPFGERGTPQIRRALAGNPGAPVAMLLPLVEDEREDVRVPLAANPSTPMECLSRLAEDPSIEVRRSLFTNPATTRELVRVILAQFHDVRRDPWFLQRLAEAPDPVKAAVASGDLLHFNLKDPDHVVMKNDAILKVMALCSGPRVAPARLARAAKSLDWYVRAAVARNEATPLEMLKRLSADPHPAVAALARRRIAVITAPTAVPDPGASTGSVDRSRIIAEMLRRFRKSSSSEYLNPQDPVWGRVVRPVRFLSDPAIWQFLEETLDVTEWRRIGSLLQAFEEKDLRKWAVRFLKLTPETRKIRAGVGRKGALMGVIRRETAEPEAEPKPKPRKKPAALPKPTEERLRELAQLARSSFLDEQEIAASSFDTPAELLLLLAQNDWKSVRYRVARNPSTPPEALESLAKDKNKEIRWAVAGNESTPAHLLATMASSRDLFVRAKVADHESTPVETLAWLAKGVPETSYNIPERVMRNPNAPKGLREAFAVSKYELVRKAAALSRRLPSALMARLAVDPSEMVRKAVAVNPDVDAATLERLARDPAPGVRARLVYNPAITPEILRILSSDTETEVLSNLIQEHETIDPAVLEVCSKSASYSLRCRVVEHPATPDALVSKLIAEVGWQPLLDRSLRLSEASILPAAFLRDAREACARRLLEWIERFAERESLSEEERLPDPAVIDDDALVRGLFQLGLRYPQASVSSLETDARSKDWLERLGVALHPNAPRELLSLLAQDRDAEVAGMAGRRLAAC